MRPFTIFLVFIIGWELLVRFSNIPSYILPSAFDVFISIYKNSELLWDNTKVTMLEMFFGLTLGIFFGVLLAWLLMFFTTLRVWLLPLLLITQALPVFAIAPLLMLWFGYGLTSKVVMTVLVIFFPVANCCYDGLRHTNPEYLELAKTMNGSYFSIMRHIRWPAALPALALGLRVAVVVAPIGAVIGEWVGSSAGLGYMMMQANARMWIDQMFAALTILSICTVSLYFFMDFCLKKWIPWHVET